MLFDFVFDHASEHKLSLIGVSILALAIFCVYWYSTTTDIKHIDGIPAIPSALPFVGHLPKLDEDPASTYQKWWEETGHSVFQIRLGNTRAVVVNSFEDAKQMLLGHQSALIDRPTLYTFHGVISSTKGFTIGTSPWGESCKKKRKSAGTTLNRAGLKNYFSAMDFESYCLLRDLEIDGKSGLLDLDLRRYMQRYALNMTLTICYGIRMDTIDDATLQEILEVGSAISRLRSASENYQDYVPLLRYMPDNSKRRLGNQLRKRRDAYLTILLDQVMDMIQKGVDKPCVSSAALKDEETKLSKIEVSSICMSLVSGGFDSVSGTLVACIGTLSSSAGMYIQEQAYREIMKYYPDTETAWQKCLEEEKVPYINALVKESTRYYTVTPMIPPRKTLTDVQWGGALIPAKTMVLVNAQAANHDRAQFGPTANQFDPTRWLTTTDGVYEELPSKGIAHFAFGAGSRACPGQIIGTRLLYLALVRLISAYKMVASESMPPNTHHVEYNAEKNAMFAVPRSYGVRLIPRDEGTLRGVLENAKIRTGV